MALGYGSHLTRLNMNLDTTCGRKLNGTSSRIQNMPNDSKKRLFHMNHASRCETKVVLIRKGHNLIDKEHDIRYCYNCIEKYFDCWYAW